MKTTIPFDGFYNSVHSAALESEVESLFYDFDTLTSHALDSCQWDKVHREYVKEYVEQFSVAFDIASLEFSELRSPKEYNFETDSIICNISLADVQKLFNAVRKSALRAHILDVCSNRSGFVSFYSNDLDEWPKSLAEWDSNQVGILVQCYVRALAYNDNWQRELMESPRSNGMLTHWVEGGIPEIERLYRIAEYLERRLTRN